MNTERFKRMIRFGALGLILVALIMTPLIDRLSVHMAGEPVRLALRPVDPRDLFRGDYVILNLAITTIRPDDLTGSWPEGLKVGDPVWVQLSKSEDGLVAKPVLIAANPPGEDGELWIQGTVDRVRGTDSGAPSLQLSYGLDAFFVPEGEGLAIETLDPEELALIILVDPRGKSLPYRLVKGDEVLLEDAGL